MSEARKGIRGEQKRRWDNANRKVCEVCGKRTWRTDRCSDHHPARLSRIGRRERIETLWKEGKSGQEIADDLGTTRGAIGVEMTAMRRAGYDLPYRHRGRNAVAA